MLTQYLEYDIKLDTYKQRILEEDYMILIKGGSIYSPEYLGEADILISNDKIEAIGNFDGIKDIIGDIEIIDAKNKIIAPGFIDQHVHILGAGGESGFETRTPEINFSQISKSGVTSLVGLLGTDGTNRDLKALLAKAKGLEREGLSTYIFTGAYEFPSPTIMGNVREDISLIDKVRGLKLAISDHRCSYPSKHELLRTLSDVRVGGMLKGILGILHLHMGDDREGLDKIFEIVNERPILIPHIVPTHVNRTEELFYKSIEFAKLGGSIDISSGLNKETLFPNTLKASQALDIYLSQGGPIENITMSSDANGSAAKYNEDGTIESMTASKIETIYGEFKDMLEMENIKIEDALKLVTKNVAKKLSIYPQKGSLEKASDADILILNEDLSIDKVFARGRMILEDGQAIVKGTFEK